MSYCSCSDHVFHFILFSYRLDKVKKNNLFVQGLRYFLTKYPYLHKIDKFYVNIKTKKFTVKYNHTLVEVAERGMDNEAFDTIVQLVKGHDKED